MEQVPAPGVGFVRFVFMETNRTNPTPWDSRGGRPVAWGCRFGFILSTKAIIFSWACMLFVILGSV